MKPGSFFNENIMRVVGVPILKSHKWSMWPMTFSNVSLY